MIPLLLLLVVIAVAWFAYRNKEKLVTSIHPRANTLFGVVVNPNAQANPLRY